MTASSAVNHIGAGGNWNAVGQGPPGKRAGRCVRRQRENEKDRSIEFRVGTLTRRNDDGGALTDGMGGRRVDTISYVFRRPDEREAKPGRWFSSRRRKT